ncbi:hypothetical protein BHU72_08280 [Desulfuribacillus stibiiarsenatis]|uniref:Class II aldolase/adducin N-terminal domain-containing protein n=1 Tax=Desulfuribacillus stibiiarsenatis TaxID=1390249 RepID=A0A1E5L4D8_9FIRM|nr:class II aldolase/adducin family protein [Desulfuribacillus stibiiarsenatis]OEH84819.1 hypothetical protein BHU72_08280 [Desulfuribacillus stibiiarsenatis]
MYRTIAQAQKAVYESAMDMVHSKLVASTWGNVSARVEEDNLIVVTPSGIDYKNLTPQDLPVIDMQGQHIEGKYQASSEKALHIALLKNRPDVHGVMHTHSVYASAFSVIREPIPPIIEDMIQIAGGFVPVAPYYLPGSSELAEGVVQSIQNQYGVLLANHGFVGIGRTVHEAFKVCLVVEKAAQIYSIARSIGKPHILDEHDVSIMRDAYLNQYSKLDMKGES